MASVFEVTIVQGGKGRVVAFLASSVEDATAKAKARHPHATILSVQPVPVREI